MGRQDSILSPRHGLPGALRQKGNKSQSARSPAEITIMRIARQRLWIGTTVGGLWGVVGWQKWALISLSGGEEYSRPAVRKEVFGD